MAEMVTLKTYLRELEGMLQNESPTEVVSHCRYILQHFPQNVATYRLLGKALLQKGHNEGLPEHFDEAADIFQRVLSVLPDDHVAHLALSEIHEQQGSLDQAIWHMERAYELMPGNQMLQEALRKLYARRAGGDQGGAKLQLSRGALARQYARNQLTNQALLELRGALQATPSRLDLEVLLAELLWESQYPVEAGETALEVLQHLPYCLPANALLARLWLAYGRPTDAQPFIERVEALDPYEAVHILHPKDDLPDGMLINRLDYAARAASSLSAETPEWVSDLGDLEEIESAFSPFTDNIDQFSPRGPERIDTAAVFASEPERAAPPAWVQEFAESEPDEAPDWFAGEAGARAPIGADEADQAEPGGETPLDADWLADDAGATRSTAAAGESGVPDWFAEVVDQESEQGAEDYAAGATDWFEDDAARDEAPETPADFARLLEDVQHAREAAVFDDDDASELSRGEPEWLSDLAEPAEPEETPDEDAAQKVDPLAWLYEDEDAAESMPEAQAAADWSVFEEGDEEEPGAAPEWSDNIQAPAWSPEEANEAEDELPEPDFDDLFGAMEAEAPADAVEAADELTDAELDVLFNAITAAEAASAQDAAKDEALEVSAEETPAPRPEHRISPTDTSELYRLGKPDTEEWLASFDESRPEAAPSMAADAEPDETSPSAAQAETDEGLAAHLDSDNPPQQPAESAPDWRADDSFALETPGAEDETLAQGEAWLRAFEDADEDGEMPSFEDILGAPAEDHHPDTEAAEDEPSAVEEDWLAGIELAAEADDEGEPRAAADWLAEADVEDVLQSIDAAVPDAELWSELAELAGEAEAEATDEQSAVEEDWLGGAEFEPETDDEAESLVEAAEAEPAAEDDWLSQAEFEAEADDVRVLLGDLTRAGEADVEAPSTDEEPDWVLEDTLEPDQPAEPIEPAAGHLPSEPMNALPEDDLFAIFGDDAEVIDYEAPDEPEEGVVAAADKAAEVPGDLPWSTQDEADDDWLSAFSSQDDARPPWQAPEVEPDQEADQPAAELAASDDDDEDWLGRFATGELRDAALDEASAVPYADLESAGADTLPEDAPLDEAEVPAPPEEEPPAARESQPAVRDESRYATRILSRLAGDSDTSEEETPAEAESGRRGLLDSVPREPEAPAWMAGLEVSDDDLGDLFDQPYDPFEGSSADNVPAYESAAKTGILQPDESPDWMGVFSGEDVPAEASQSAADEGAEDGEPPDWEADAEDEATGADWLEAPADQATASVPQPADEAEEWDLPDDDLVLGMAAEEDADELDDGEMPDWLNAITQAAMSDEADLELDEDDALDVFGDSGQAPAWLREMDAPDDEAGEVALDADLSDTRIAGSTGDDEEAATFEDESRDSSFSFDDQPPAWERRQSGGAHDAPSDDSSADWLWNILDDEEPYT